MCVCADFPQVWLCGTEPDLRIAGQWLVADDTIAIDRHRRTRAPAAWRQSVPAERHGLTHGPGVRPPSPSALPSPSRRRRRRQRVQPEVPPAAVAARAAGCLPGRLVTPARATVSGGGGSRPCVGQCGAGAAGHWVGQLDGGGRPPVHRPGDADSGHT